MIHIEHHDHTAVLRFEHGKAHALDVALTAALLDALGMCDRDDNVRAVVITGTGTIFCAGVDLYQFLDGGEAYIDKFVPLLRGAFGTLFRFPKPVVAAINGHAIAGGCVLAAACDYRIMARGPGTIGVPELRVGLPFPLVAIEILRFATSEAHLQELVYRGMTYKVEQAYERGLIDEVSSSTELLRRALDIADSLSSEPSARFRITKYQLRSPAVARMEHGAAESDEQVVAAWKDPATVEAITKYLEEVKRQK